MTVSTDSDKRPHITINLDVTFPNVPCFLLRILMKTSVNEMDEEEMTKSLTWAHEDENFSVVEVSKNRPTVFTDSYNSSDEEEYKKIQNFFDQKLKCHVYGSVEVSKVTGQFAFVTRGDSKAFEKFMTKNREEWGNKYKLRINHNVNSWTYGDTRQQKIIHTLFGSIDDGIHTMFNMFNSSQKVVEELKTLPEDEP